MAKRKLSVNSPLEQLATFPENTTISFSDIPRISFKAHNISRCILTGSMTLRHELNSVNIIQSVLKDIEARTSFYNGDIKDSRIENSTFKNCNFNEAAHINNSVSHSRFEKCSFNQTSITYSEFERVIFTGCDFTNCVISDSRFIECTFIHCRTSNKLAESSLFLDCAFVKMDFNLEFVSENFGIEEVQLKECRFRVKEGRKTKRHIDTASAIRANLETHIPPIEKFRWKFFDSPVILSEGSDIVDKTFEPESWMEISGNANRFRMLIEKYHEFLMYQFEKDRAPFWNLLKLHNMTGTLSEMINPAKYVEASRAVLGVHMSLVRLIEPFFALAADIADKCISEKRIKLLVNGPLDIHYYETELNPVLKETSLKIEKVIKHNSPKELHIWVERIYDCLPFITMILALKGKLGLSKVIGLKQYEQAALKSISPANQDGLTSIDVLKTEFGFDNTIKTYAFKLQALLPGEHLFTVHIRLRTGMLGKIKKIILDLLPSQH